MENRPLLDITTINTKEDLNKVNFKDFCDEKYYNDYVKYIKYPVLQEELDRICKLSEGKLYNNMGELFLSK